MCLAPRGPEGARREESGVSLAKECAGRPRRRPGLEPEVKCKACGSEAQEGASFCTQCGARLETGARAHAPGNAPDTGAHQLLTMANLFRIRGDWESAEQKCIEALRLFPENASAHSLLGDIYASQKRWEEAAQRYQLAIDLDPENPADREKLEQARQRAADALVPLPARKTTPGTRARGTHRPRLSPPMQLAVVAIISFVAVLLVMSLREAPQSGQLTPSEGFPVALPGGAGGLAPGSPSPAAGLAPRQPAPATTGEPAPPAANAPTAAPSVPAEARAPADPAPTSPTASVPAPEMSEWEARAFSRLQLEPWIRAHASEIRIVGLLWEPMHQRVLVTAWIPRASGIAGLRQEGPRIAYGVGQALARIGFKRFEVLVKAPISESRGAEVVIAAEAEGVQTGMWNDDPSTADPQVLLTRFANIWWHPQLH